MKKIIAVVLNWNGYKYTIACLKSLQEFNTKGIDFEIVIVDNGSTDDSVKNIKRVTGSNGETALIETGDNLGYAGGNNAGIQYALARGADYILLMNNDIRADKSALSNMLLLAEKHTRAGIITPMIYFEKGFEFHKKRYNQNEKGRVIWSAGGYFDNENVFGVNRGVDEVDIGQYNSPETLEFATGAAMLLRSASLEEVGLFDERYFLYFEDADLCKRMRKNGWEIWYSPEAKIWHLVSQSSAIGGALNDYFITRNRLLFGIKYMTHRTKIALMRESLRLLMNGRRWQRRGVIDYYLHRFGRGSWNKDIRKK